MEQGVVVNIAMEALEVVMLISAPLLIVSVVVGLAVSILQATTQIHEQTLTFVPKIIAVFASIAFFGAWMINTLVEYTVNLYSNMNQFIK